MHKFKLFLILYFISVLFIYLFFLIKDNYSFLVLSLIGGLFIVVIVGVFLILNKSEIIKMEQGNRVRYDMLCHSCNWGWLSNVREGDKPLKCPNCGNNSKLEVVGWKKVSTSPRKQDKELTSFLNKNS